MSKREAVIIGVLGLLAIIQVSFSPHFSFFSKDWFVWINLIDIAVVAIALFEKKRNRLGWWSAAWGGIFLDIYSGRFFGFWIIILSAIVAFIKFVLKKYVRIPSYW